jgi:ParB-like chromosome segregation protein Spo0J
VQPLLVDGSRELIGGHGLLEAARSAGYTEVPIIRLAHLEEPQKRALRIALNRLAELSQWDEALLAIEFKELLEIDLELDLSFSARPTARAQRAIRSSRVRLLPQ